MFLAKCDILEKSANIRKKNRLCQKEILTQKGEIQVYS